MSQNFNCPDCGSSQFVTEPNQYDILEFSSNGFEVVDYKTIDDYKVFCRECGVEVDLIKSTKKIVCKG